MTHGAALRCRVVVLEGCRVTYKTETARDSKRVMQALVVLFIVWVAFWASTGGLDRMLADDTTTEVVRSAA